MTHPQRNELSSPYSIFARPDVDIKYLDNGDFLLRSRDPLGPYATRITDRLQHWANVAPDRPFLAQRLSGREWQTVTYAQALERARCIGQAMLDMGCGPAAPVATLSENSIESACFILGALYAGIPVAPISPTYATLQSAQDKLRACMETLDPRIVYVAEPNRSLSSLRAVCHPRVAFVAPKSLDGIIALGALSAHPSSVDDVNHAITGDTIAKYLFTSGSTGAPKAVINTQRMLCANQQQLLQIYPFFTWRPPVFVDWLPWHHTFGGNEVFFLTMCNGGTLYIDEGKPVGSQIETTIANLRDVSPTVYFNVPRGFDQLASRMQMDTDLRERFFSRLDMMFYSGAGMPQETWNRLEELALSVRGKVVPMITAWGATETAPFATGVHFESRRSDNIGLPAPGCDIKFALTDGRHELRVRGPNVMPGYLKREDVSHLAFDTDGFYRTGDAGRLVDPSDPRKGIVFDGRVAEDFKLQSGTWVSVGRLRGLLSGALNPVASDVIILAPDRNAVSLLIFLDIDAARFVAGDAGATLPDLSRHEAVIAAIGERIQQHNLANPSSSTRIVSFHILPEGPSIEARELTDKGSISQAAVLRYRAETINDLYDGVLENVVHLS